MFILYSLYRTLYSSLSVAVLSLKYCTVLFRAELRLEVISLVIRAGQDRRTGYWAHVLSVGTLEWVDLFLDHAMHPIDHSCTDLWRGSNSINYNFSGSLTDVDDPWGPTGRDGPLPNVGDNASTTSKGLHRVSGRSLGPWSLFTTLIRRTPRRVRWRGRHCNPSTSNVNWAQIPWFVSRWSVAIRVSLS